MICCSIIMKIIKSKKSFKIFCIISCFQNFGSSFYIYGITRQGVHDLIKRCNRILKGYEEKLQLVEKFLTTKKLVQEIYELSQEIEEKPEKKEILHNFLLPHLKKDHLILHLHKSVFDVLLKVPHKNQIIMPKSVNVGQVKS